jgi:hypothetical protein
MKKTPVLTAAILAVLVWTGSTALAQTNALRSATMNVDFSFVVAGSVLPAGSYVLEVDQSRVLVRPKSGGGEGAFAGVITRLGRHDNDADPELVFDKIGGQYHLSELWLPGQDGYLMLGTKEQHDHRVLGGSNPHK